MARMLYFHFSVMKAWFLAILMLSLIGMISAQGIDSCISFTAQFIACINETCNSISVNAAVQQVPIFLSRQHKLRDAALQRHNTENSK
jgi:hypothetical protein